jgi:hypothetical protein
MRFRTTDPLTGAELPPQQQLDMRMKNPNWRAESQIPGSAAQAELAQLKGRAAGVNPQELVAELRELGQTDKQISEVLARFGLDAKDAATQEGLTAPAATSISATDIVIPWGDVPPDLSEEDRADLRAVDTTVREWGVALEAPAKNVNALVEAVNDAMLKLPNDPDGIEASREAGLAKVKAAWGADFQRNFDAACRVIDDLYSKHPGAANFVQANRHAILQPMVMGNLLQIARHRGFV